MANKNESWEDLLERVNKNLKWYGAELIVVVNDDDDYDLEVKWADGEKENYSSGCFESDLDDVLNEAWGDIRCKANERGDKILRCIVHIDTPDIGMSLQRGEFYHAFELIGSVEQAVRWMNHELKLMLDEKVTVTDINDLSAANAALHRKYGESSEEVSVYASIEDITEETIVKCSEVFCEHHWSHEALMKVADELSIDLYDVEKND